jgi:hypothetical protein
MIIEATIGLVTERYSLCDCTSLSNELVDIAEESPPQSARLPSWQRLQSGTVIPASFKRSSATKYKR